MSAGVLIVGAGMAAEQLAVALRRGGFDEPITAIGDDPHFPYQRPPLSKSYLKGGDVPPLGRPRSFFADRGIDLRLGVAVTGLDLESQEAELDGGERIGYRHLVLATGSRNRRLPMLADALDLRTRADADAIRARLEPGARLAIVGGGFIGLEVAAAARHRGVEVVVIEMADRLMPRALSPPLAEYLREEHERAGVSLLLGRSLASVEGDGVVLDDGERVAADTVVAGVGVVPNVELAERAGLETGDGIVVDRRLRASRDSVWAIGDCASFPCGVSGRRIRLESVQNANDQARFVAGQILGDDVDYVAVPWFWTEQYDHRVQLAGVAAEGDEALRGPGPVDGGGFSVYRFNAGGLVAVESVDRPADHVAARKLLADPALRASWSPDSLSALGVERDDVAAPKKVAR